MTVTAHPATATPSPRRRALGVAAAVLTPAAIWVIGAIAGVDYTVENPGQPAFVVGFVPVLIFSLGSALVGWFGLAVLERLARRRAAVIWTTLAVALTLLSLIPVFATEATTGAKIVLSVIHLAVAAPLIALLPTRAH
ncbi:DUF6069 family protein [Micromonospora halophytica]|uniref:Uncharacterized protein n=1 Tax=Micromonospora halophytica TaxID=47864 RepID=A0A1C5JBR0_9ACTN|nr:DUF6069 family protein [Micromonospora halophytica]SCG67619.1 hypothetical protein GA0070560_1269 [Micromonospora halophytica]